MWNNNVNFDFGAPLLIPLGPELDLYNRFHDLTIFRRTMLEGDHEMEGVDDEVPLTDHLTRKRTRLASLNVNEDRVAKCHDEEVAGLKGRIVELEDELPSTKLRKKSSWRTFLCYLNRLLHFAKFSQAFAWVKKKVTSLGAHNMSVKICERVLEFPKAELKLDKDVAMKVADEAAALSMKSWPYFLEIVTSKNEDINGLMAIRVAPNIVAPSSCRCHD
nr:hypothetical protein [Tanacetum cinerariifolium]